MSCRKVNHAVFLVMLLLVFMAACNDAHHNPARPYYIGKFRLDPDKSKLRSYEKDSDLYKGVTLILKENDSFYFSTKAPFIRKQTGKWTMKPIDNLYSAYLLYDTGQYGVVYDHVYRNADSSIEISSPLGDGPLGRESQTYAEYLRFDRLVPATGY